MGLTHETWAVLAVFTTIYNALLWVLWSVVLPIAFVVGLIQWRRFNTERCEKERLERIKLVGRLADAGIETDFTEYAPLVTDKDRHLSCLQRLKTQTEALQRLQQTDKKKPSRLNCPKGQNNM